MYSGFIEEKLAENSYVIKLFKDSIENFKEDWNDNFDEVLIKDVYEALNNFYSINYHEYDNEELLFIYKSIYSLAGFKNSLIKAGEFLGVIIDVESKESELNITVNMKGENFKDAALGYTYLNALIRDLLFYKTSTIEFTQLSYKVDVINISYNKIYVNPIVDKYSDKNEFYIGD